MNIKRISCLAAALSYGLASLTLFPSGNYQRHISSASSLMEKAWNKTGDSMRFAIEKVGEEAESAKKQETT